MPIDEGWNEDLELPGELSTDVELLTSEVPGITLSPGIFWLWKSTLCIMFPLLFPYRNICSWFTNFSCHWIDTRMSCTTCTRRINWGVVQSTCQEKYASLVLFFPDFYNVWFLRIFFCIFLYFFFFLSKIIDRGLFRSYFAWERGKCIEVAKDHWLERIPFRNTMAITSFMGTKLENWHHSL